MTNEIATPSSDPMKDFQEKVSKKVREDIANLLPEEAIKALFDKAIDDIFFKATPELRNSYNNVTQKAEPSWFHKALVESAKPLIEAEIKRRVDEFKPEIEAVVKEHLTQQQLILTSASVVTKLTIDACRADAYQMVNQIVNDLRGGVNRY